MKHKIPTDVFTHPDSGQQALYDPETRTITTLAGDRPIPIDQVEGRRDLAKLREWEATLQREIP